MSIDAGSNISNEQNGFLYGISNAFSGAIDFAVDNGTKLFDLSNKWTSASAMQDQIRAQSKVEELRANLALTAENNSLVSKQQFNQILMFGTMGLILVGGGFILIKAFKK